MATRTISTKLAIQGESEYRAQLQKINSNIKELQSSLKLTESRFQTNANSMEALTEKGKALKSLLGEQQTKVDKLKTALENAQDAQKKYAEQHKTLTEKIEANTIALENLKKATGDTSEEQAKLTAENKELKDQLEKCDANLDAAEKGVNSWKTQLNNAEIKLNDLDAELKLNDEYLNEAKDSADGCATSIDRFGDRTESAAEKADTLRDALAAAGVIAALKETAEALEACIDSSIEFESGMAGVAKTTDLTETELADMADAIQEMSTRIPATTTEIAEVVESAGQLGIAKEDLLDFAEVMVNLGTSTNLSSTEAAEALAKFANVVGMSSDDYERLGSTIVALGNNFATTEADIVSMATRLSSTGSLVGLSESEIMAIATALSSVGIEAEAGGSAISKLLKKFETMVATGDEDLSDFAAIAGMSADEFSQKWGEDAVGALSLFIDGLGDIDAAGGSSVAVLSDLGITEVNMSNAVQSLASSQGILESALETANSAWEDNTALATEANTRYETTESKLQMLSNSFDNVKIAIGDKLTPAVGDLAEAGTDALSWLADMIEDSDLLVPLVTAAGTAIGVFTVAISAYTAVTKLAAAASELFSAVLSNTNPVFLAITAIGALVTGIGVLISTINDDAVPSVEDLTSAAQALPDAFEDANETYEDTEDDVLAAVDAAQKYIDRLKELEEQGDLTEEQQAEYNIIVDKLRALLPEVNIALDEQTGLLEGGTAALEAQIDAWEDVALYQALSTKYQTQLDAWADAAAEVAINTHELEEAQKEHKELTEKLEADTETYTNLLEEQKAVEQDMTLTYEERDEKLRGLTDSIYEMADSLDYTSYQITANEATQETLNQAIEDGTAVADQYNQELTEAKAVLDEYEESQEKAKDGTEGMTGATEQNEEAIQSLKDRITALAEAYSTAYQSAYDSIDGQIGLFDTFAQSAEEDTLTVQDMLEKWAEQTSNLATYTENLKKAADYGLDNGLITSLSDGSTESAGYLATIIDKIEELGGSTEGMSDDATKFVSEFNAAFESTNEAKESFAETVAGIETDLADSIAAMEKEAEEIDFSGFASAVETAFGNVNVDFESIGLNMGAGLAGGIDSSSGDVSAAAESMASDATAAARDELGVHSPSTVFKEIGQNLDIGMQQGIQGKVSVVIAAVESMGQQINTKMQQSATQAVNSFSQEFAQITSRTSTVCSSLCSTVIGTTSSLPSSMSSIGAQMVNGMISGLNSRSSALYSTVSSIVNSAIYKAKKAAAVNSPSKKTTEIFEFVGEGMIVGLENKREKIKAEAQSVVDDALNLNPDGKLKSAIENINAEDSAGIDAVARETANYSERSVTVNVNISRFENNSDKDLDQIVEYVEDSLQSKINKKEAAL